MPCGITMFCTNMQSLIRTYNYNHSKKNNSHFITDCKIQDVLLCFIKCPSFLQYKHLIFLLSNDDLENVTQSLGAKDMLGFFVLGDL